VKLSHYILGISAFYHDSAAALLRDGEIIAAAQEERFTRKKHDPAFPAHAARYCLKHAGIKASDLDVVAYYDKPFVTFDRLLETYLGFAPFGVRQFIAAMPLWIKKKLWIPSIIGKELDYEGEVLFCDHHESHAAAAFFPSPFDSAAILTMDGVGEWTTTSWGVGKDNAIDLKSEVRFPHSLGLLYSAFTYYTGFKVNSGEYKIMGLAPYGEPKYVQTIYDNLIDVREDGSFRLNMQYFNYCQGLTMTNRRFDKLIGGPPRKPESELTQREMDLARSVQVVTEEIMLRCANHVHKETGEKNLCMAGGVALNCVGNGRILREGPFSNLWIQPAAGDAGGALGVALYMWHHYYKKDRVPNGVRDRQSASYLGPAWSDEELAKWLEDKKLPFHSPTEDELPQKVADILADEKVVGWFQGRMEFGPRALGARSIIGDARSSKMQSTMNLKIKYRESFRPFAPTVLADKVSDFFEMDCESPYMLLVAPVRKELRKQMSEQQESLFGIDKLNVPRSTIPAITHVDYSARVQTVTEDDNPRYYRTIKAFGEKTGVSVVINTSFNVRGEPIVCTPEDAYRCFMRTEMDVLVLGSHILYKEEQPEFEEKGDWRKEFELD
jgi:carbamoyltransferase